MKSVALRIIALLLITLMIVQFAGGQKTKREQEKKEKGSCDCPVAYDNVIDDLFPSIFVGLGNGYKMRLRYSRPNHPEMQINIIYPDNGQFEVVLYKSIQRSILLQVQDMQVKNKNIEFKDIVKRIQVSKTRINLSESEVKGIRESFLETVKKSAEIESKRLIAARSSVMITFDQAGYELRYYGSGTIKLYGEGNSIAGKPFPEEPPFIQWMREIYAMVEKRR